MRTTEFQFDLDDSFLMLSPAEMALRQRFVDQYVIDYNSFLAAQRVGFNTQSAARWGKLFLNESYVQNLIKEKELNKAKLEDEDQELQDISIILATLRDVAQNGTFGSRVQAATTLAKIRGLDKFEKEDEKVRGGVMVIPAIADIDNWQELAMSSQQALAEDALADFK